MIEAGNARGWAWLAHGETNSLLHTDLERDDEHQRLTAMRDAIEAATGDAPSGWMGPALTETEHTPGLLAELGMTYTLDWTNDDQPYWFDDVPVMSVPYTVELNDLGMFTAHGMTGQAFEQMASDHLEQLLDEPRPSVMPIALHPFVTGQASRVKYLDRFLTAAVADPRVAVMTSDDIARHYAATFPYRRVLDPEAPARR